MIDLDKKYQTRSGKEVVGIFHYPENPEDCRIIVHVMSTDGVEAHAAYDDGMVFDNGDKTNYDLIPIPTKVTRWFNVYKDSNSFYLGIPYASERDAKELLGDDESYDRYIKTIPITVEID